MCGLKFSTTMEFTKFFSASSHVYSTGCPKKFDVILNANISETTQCILMKLHKLYVEHHKFYQLTFQRKKKKQRFVDSMTDFIIFTNVQYERRL